MYSKVYITLFLTCFVYVVHGNQCPVIHAKEASQCAGQISECWSPGLPDVDCDNGLCCFDGCVNVCGKPQCQTVMETKFENVTKEVCHLVEQPPVCTTRVEQDCTNNCETIDEEVPTQVEKETCTTKTESVCEEVSSEACVLPNSQDDKCPIVFAQPAETCLSESASDCWSPGVPDLDCPHAGLCCFDGCSNKCVNKTTSCHQVETNVCNPIQVEQCEDKPVIECNDKSVPVKVPTYTKTCTRTERVCTTMPTKVCQGNECKDVEYSECTTTKVPNKKVELKEVCKDTVVEECTVVLEQVCTGSKIDSYRPYECKKVPKKTCVNKTVTKCSQVENVVEELVDKEVCVTKTRSECKVVEYNPCREIDMEKCIEATPEVCNEVLTHVDDEIICNQCLMVSKTECKTFTKDECTIESKEVCPDCEKKVITNTRCSQIPKEFCEKTLVTENKVVPKEVCTKVCTPREETDCTYVEPKNVCSKVVKTMSYPVPVLKCF